MHVAVITASIASPWLGRAIRSVQLQTYKDLTHYIVVDGSEYADGVQNIIAEVGQQEPKILILPQNTGAQGSLGHKIYAAAPFLIDADIFVLLDDDNYFEPSHITDCVSALTGSGREWGNSLRRIIDRTGQNGFLDNAESLGGWPRFFNCYEKVFAPYQELLAFMASRRFLADTSTLFFRKSIAADIKESWLTKPASDAVVTSRLVNIAPGVCTGLYTLNYSLPDNRFGRYRTYYEFANAKMSQILGTPWCRGKGKEYVLHPSITQANALFDRVASRIRLDELPRPTSKHISLEELKPRSQLIDRWLTE